MIKYISTNRNLPKNKKASAVSFKAALLQGIATDDGLYMPSQIPAISLAEIDALSALEYHQIAAIILRKFLEDEIESSVIDQITADAYNFELPIEKIDQESFIMRLDQGPTASFKDFAARFMARMMQHLKKPAQKLTILVATSGDTGGAVGDAYHGLDGIQVFILYPLHEVSPLQQKQLDGIGDNVQAIALDGTFDDCQKLVKQAFIDPELSHLNLTSANSINIGRILPQIVYYFYAYAKICKNHEKMNVVVPSGNFGNSLGCEIARRMGLPINKIILAVNLNDQFPNFLDSGEYNIVSPSRACISNAMNVGNPSNLARYFDLYGGTVDKEGKVHQQPDLALMRANLFSTSISDQETIAAIKKTYQEKKIIIEPHGAVGLVAYQKYKATTNENYKTVILETAHPAKFIELMEQYLPATITMPPSIKKYIEGAGQHDNIKNEYKSFKEYIKNNGMD